MNTYGTLFKITLYGASHEQSMGVIIDGVPPGIFIDQNQISHDLDQRKSGKIGTTPRSESDAFVITSGVFQGYSTGAPIHVTIHNENVISKDYQHLVNHPRPGHADFVAQVKYKGFQDYRGGGAFSGRLTALIVVAGAIAKMIIPFKLSHQLISVGDLSDMSKLDDYLSKIALEGDSVGGVIELQAKQMIVGLGEPYFQKLDAEIAKMMFCIPAVKALNIGTGFLGTSLKGSQFNDAILNKEGTTKTNHSGGISGGISNGNDLVMSVMIKPASSIKLAQTSYQFEAGQVEKLEIGGRHDVCIARRAGIVLENALAIVLADQFLIYKAYQ